ncbi:MAG: PAS domain-containing sensor histidine kinase [Bacteroidales bacterium]|nr:PAS domain-containing sensor histidine kinase [Bacteroidales bacterium]
MNFSEILFDHVSSAIVVVDRSLLIKKCNKKFQELFGIKVDFINQPLGNTMGCFTKKLLPTKCGDDEKCLTCKIKDSINEVYNKNNSSPVFLFTEQFIVDGEPKKYHLNIRTKYLDYESGYYAMIIMDDVSELEEKRIHTEMLNSKLREMIRKKNEFLGIAAHDLRNPLSLIQSATNYIIDRKESVDPETYKKLMESILQTSQFSLELVNELLDVSAIETGKISLNLKSEDYNKLVYDCVEQNRNAAYNKGISIDIIRSDRVENVLIDRNKIFQVLSNLLSNAIKYSFPFKQIEIEVINDGEYVLTKVRDEGQGIPEAEQESIFEAFKKSSVMSTGGEKSTGLGLSIVKEFVKEHGGKIELKSSPGLGSEFIFSLPYKK